MDKAKEKQMISRARKGELTAFEELVKEYEQRVFALAYRYCGNEQDAQDVVQEVFLRVYRSLKGFRGESGFSTWIYRITSNICVDHIRAEKGAHNISLETEEGEQPIPDAVSLHQPEAAAENAILREALKEALALLSAEHRQILLLREIIGLSYVEISKMLRLEEGTVKSRLARARKQMREILIEQGNIAVPQTSKQTEGRTAR